MRKIIFLGSAMLGFDLGDELADYASNRVCF